MEMKAFRQWASERQQVLLTRLVNRSFRQNPNLLDRLALRVVERAFGPVGEPDPELEHRL